MANKKKASSALAITSNDELASALDDLDLGLDGFEEADNTDIKIPSKILNYKGKDKNDDPVLPNQFFDTLTEQSEKSIECTILLFTKSHEYKYFDDSKNESVLVCRSFDRTTGLMADGGERACAGCPHIQWRNEDGKRKKDCGVVYNVLAVDAQGHPFFYRVKRTAVNELKTYLNRHFLGKLKGGRNVPAFAYKTILSAKMQSKGSTTWAVPVFELGEMNPREAIVEHAESAKFYQEVMRPALEKASDVDHDAGGATGSAPDTSFNPADFSDDDAAPVAANSF